MSAESRPARRRSAARSGGRSGRSFSTRRADFRCIAPRRGPSRGRRPRRAPAFQRPHQDSVQLQTVGNFTLRIHHSPRPTGSPSVPRPCGSSAAPCLASQRSDPVGRLSPRHHLIGRQHGRHRDLALQEAGYDRLGQSLREWCRRSRGEELAAQRFFPLREGPRPASLCIPGPKIVSRPPVPRSAFGAPLRVHPPPSLARRRR